MTVEFKAALYYVSGRIAMAVTYDKAVVVGEGEGGRGVDSRDVKLDDGALVSWGSSRQRGGSGESDGWEFVIADGDGHVRQDAA